MDVKTNKQKTKCKVEIAFPKDRENIAKVLKIASNVYILKIPDIHKSFHTK